MKGVVFLGDRKLELREFPDPTPGPREVVLEIKASGMCGSDLHNYRATPQPGGAVTGGIKRAEGVIAGHEPCGVVVAVGTGVGAKRGQGRPARHGPSLRRVRQLQALPGRLDADVPRGHHCLRLGRPWRPCQVHEGAGAHAGAAAGRAFLRHRRRHLLRHRHGLWRPQAGQPARRRNHRHLRPGTGRAVGDAACRRHGRPRHRPRRLARAPRPWPRSSAPR